MLGSDAIKIKVNWHLSFIGYGTTVSPMRGVIFADVGNALLPGVIDHHSGDSGCKSTAAIIAANPHLVLNHLMGSLVDEFLRRPWTPEREVSFEFVTHEDPDWDGVCSFYLVQHLVQYGQLPNSRIKDALSASADIVDQGLAKVKGDVARPYLIYQIIKESQRWPQAMEKGIELIKTIIELRKDSDHPQHWLVDPVSSEKLSMFSNEIAKLNQDFELFEKDKRDAKPLRFDVELATRSGSVNKVQGFAFTAPPKCKLHKYWIREIESPGVLVVPFQKKDDPKTIDRYIISVRPETPYSLRRLGYELELKEKEAKEKCGRPRSGQSRWNDKEYCDNDDPWYDGRGHEFTIVDSPRSGTCLSFDDVMNIVRGRFHAVKLNQRKLSLFGYTGFLNLNQDTAEWKEEAVFSDLPGALGALAGVKLRAKDLTCDGWSGHLFYSPHTQHVLLQVNVPQAELPKVLDDWPAFIEELRRGFVNPDSKAKSRSFIREAAKYGVKEEKWEKYCFTLCVIEPDLRQHDLGRVSRLFRDITYQSVSKENMEDFRRTSDCLSIVGPAGILFLRETMGDACGRLVLYAMFQKSGFGVFSSRLIDSTSNIRGEAGKSQDFAPILEKILKLQIDFSRFLSADYVSEVSGDQRVQILFEKIAGALRMKKRCDETQEEMARLGELVNGLDEKQDKKFQDWLTFLGFLFVIPSLIFSFLGVNIRGFTSGNDEGLTRTTAMLIFGLVFAVSCLAWFVLKKLPSRNK